ncbi:MAG: hypothetical protein K0S65_5924, partial [Labilithrix sp.]|nr:hypothetical protein [Labilithrix sp.]
IALATPPDWLLDDYLWDATLGELCRRLGDHDRAVRQWTRALEAAPTHVGRALVQCRLRACP